MAKVSIGLLVGQAAHVLWHRRLAVAGITLAWLVLEGFATAIFHPAFALMLPRLGLEFLDPAWLSSDWLFTALVLPQPYIRDVIRAVFVVILLRMLLAPPAGAETGKRAGFIVPLLVILVLEFAWSSFSLPIEQRLHLAAMRAREDGVLDLEAFGILSVLARVTIYGVIALAVSRLCFVYPNIVLWGGLRLSQSWRDTEHIFLRLFVILLAIPIPILVPGTLLVALAGSSSFVSEAPLYVALVLSVVNSAQGVLVSVVALAAIAAAYAAVTGHPAAAMPGISRLPERMAEAFE